MVSTAMEPKIEPTTQENQAPSERGNRREYPKPVPRLMIQKVEEDPNSVHVMLDAETSKTIRRITDAQQLLQKEIEGSHEDTFSLRVLVKTQETRLGQLFKRMGDVMEDQWGLRMGFDEIKDEFRTAATEQQVPAPVKDKLREPDPGPAAAPRSNIESLYASENEQKREAVQQGTEQQSVKHAEPCGTAKTPGEAWI